MLVITGARRGLGYALSNKHECLCLTRESFDVSNGPDTKKHIAGIAFPMEPLHVLHLAGVSLSGFIHKQDGLDGMDVVHTNLLGSWNLLRAFQPVLKERLGSTITLISSVVTERPVGGTAAYCMSKAGVEGLTRTAALEFSRIGARVNCLQLGYFDQGMITQVPAEYQAKLLEEIPLHRFGNVDDLWEAWQFLIKCKYVNGAIVPVNGGLR